MGKTKHVKTSSKIGAKSATLEALIQEQGVSPADDLDEIGALWPPKDDLEQFEKFIAAQCARRRHATHG